MAVRGCRVVRQTAQQTTRSLVRQLVSVVERELEREGRPESFGGPGKVEMGAADDLLLPLALSAGAPAADFSSPRTPSEELGVASAVLPVADGST